MVYRFVYKISKSFVATDPVHYNQAAFIVTVYSFVYSISKFLVTTDLLHYNKMAFLVNGSPLCLQNEQVSRYH